ncbi:MAG: UDP-N-acetylmuramate dehydrogenase [Candidatus Omnitrophica bacterium]|nr:UDP-N-acetylmuramate dehydrogenase [Candidatus Omnitrophota bacterium]
MGKVKVEEKVPLSSMTSFRTGGPARYFAAPSDREEAQEVIAASEKSHEPLLVLGNGTNILISDEGFSGVVLSTQNLNKITVEGEKIVCGAGTRLQTVIKTALEHSLAGMEFLAGVPGSAGGAVILNAGLKEEWISRVLEEVEVLGLADNQPQKIHKQDIDFKYRGSGLEKVLILSITLNLKKGDKKEIQAKIAENMKKRMESQPLEYPSAGSVFKNPPGMFAGQMIEKCGLKGYGIGGARVSEKHANFIVNAGGAKAEDIYRLIGFVREKVKKVYNVELETEIRIIGKFG